MKKILMSVFIFLFLFSIYGCGGNDAESPSAPQVEPEEVEVEEDEAPLAAVESPEIDMKEVTEDLAAVVNHFINQGINITRVEPLLGGMENMGWIAGIYVSTDITFFELFQYDLDSLDEQAQRTIENIDDEYTVLNGNIMMAKPDRFDEYEEDYYTEAVEAIIEAFENY